MCHFNNNNHFSCHCVSLQLTSHSFESQKKNCNSQSEVIWSFVFQSGLIFGPSGVRCQCVLSVIAQFESVLQSCLVLACPVCPLEWMSLCRGEAPHGQASRPRRAILADRKECRMKTMGLGQECRSSCFGREKTDGGRLHAQKKQTHK